MYKKIHRISVRFMFLYIIMGRRRKRTGPTRNSKAERKDLLLWRQVTSWNCCWEYNTNTCKRGEKERTRKTAKSLFSRFPLMLVKFWEAFCARGHFVGENDERDVKIHDKDGKQIGLYNILRANYLGQTDTKKQLLTILMILYLLASLSLSPVLPLDHSHSLTILDFVIERFV